MKKTSVSLQDGEGHTFAMLTFDESHDAICRIVVAGPETFNGERDVVELDEEQFLELFEAAADLMRKFGRDPHEYLAPAND